METRKVTESRTTIVYMAGFGTFVLLSYMLVVAPLKEQRECFLRMKYTGESVTQQEPEKAQPSKEVNYEQAER
jgi:hypothetical protein